MTLEDKLKEIFESIKARASSDFSCMHVMSKDEFISEYVSKVMDATFQYYTEQGDIAREKHNIWRDKHYGG